MHLGALGDEHPALAGGDRLGRVQRVDPGVPVRSRPGDRSTRRRGRGRSPRSGRSRAPRNRRRSARCRTRCGRRCARGTRRAAGSARPWPRSRRTTCTGPRDCSRRTPPARPAFIAASGVAMKVFDGHSTVSPCTLAKCRAARAPPDQLPVADRLGAVVGLPAPPRSGGSSRPRTSGPSRSPRRSGRAGAPGRAGRTRSRSARSRADRSGCARKPWSSCASRAQVTPIVPAAAPPASAAPSRLRQRCQRGRTVPISWRLSSLTISSQRRARCAGGSRWSCRNPHRAGGSRHRPAGPSTPGPRSARRWSAGASPSPTSTRAAVSARRAHGRAGRRGCRGRTGAGASPRRRPVALSIAAAPRVRSSSTARALSAGCGPVAVAVQGDQMAPGRRSRPPAPGARSTCSPTRKNVGLDAGLVEDVEHRRGALGVGSVVERERHPAGHVSA